MATSQHSDHNSTDHSSTDHNSADHPSNHTRDCEQCNAAAPRRSAESLRAERKRRRRWLRRAVVGVAAGAALVAFGSTWPRSGAVATRLWDKVAAAADDEVIEAGAAEGQGNQFWTCGMHPWVILPAPGLCPICHMDLTPLDPAKLAGEIAIDPVTVQNIGVRVEPVQEGPLTKEIRTVGTVSYDESAIRDVNTKISGWIEKLHVDQTGDLIRKGDPLFELYSPELYQAQSEYLISLDARNSIGRDLLESARAKLEMLDITPEQIRALERRGEATKTMTVVSPHTGTVIDKQAHEGMKIDSGMRVYRIADLSKVWVLATFYEYQLPYVKVGQPVVITLPYLPGERLEGRVSYIYPYLNNGSRQVKARLEFANPAGTLKPGMFANVKLQSTLAERAVLAPREAVISTGERQVAFVSLGQGRFEPRHVRTGTETESGQVEILEGIQPGEMLVTSGQFLLDSESKMRTALAKMVRGSTPADQSPTPAADAPVMLAARPEQAVQQQIDRTVTAYLAVQQGLAHDQIEHVEHQLAAIADAAKQLTEADDVRLAEAATSVSHAASKRSTDVKQMRENFADLSKALIELVRRTPPSAAVAAQLQQAYCSMADARWLQASSDIANPYMGTKMRSCGEIQLNIPSRA